MNLTTTAVGCRSPLTIGFRRLGVRDQRYPGCRDKRPLKTLINGSGLCQDRNRDGTENQKMKARAGEEREKTQYERIEIAKKLKQLEPS